MKNRKIENKISSVLINNSFLEQSENIIRILYIPHQLLFPQNMRNVDPREEEQKMLESHEGCLQYVHAYSQNGV